MRQFLDHLWPRRRNGANAAGVRAEQGSSGPATAIVDKQRILHLVRACEALNEHGGGETFVANPAERQARRFSYESRPGAGRRYDGETPSFGHLSNTRFALERSSDGNMGLVHARMELPDAFTPSRPTRWGRGFVGRRPELRRIISAIEDELSHVAIYGEHGQGKTSLTHALGDLAAIAGYQVAYFGCSPELDFEQIFRRVFRNLPRSASRAPASVSAEDRGQAGIEYLLPPGTLGPVDVAIAVGAFRSAQVIVMLDDFDQASAATRDCVNELMKRISDFSGRMTIVVIGSGRRIEHLLESEVSVRTAVGLELPRLSDEEIAAIVEGGAARIGVKCSAGMVSAIIDHACGSPYVAHLLALHGTRHALEHSRLLVDETDLRAAVASIYEDMPRALSINGRDPLGDLDRKTAQASPNLTADLRDLGGDTGCD
ncbi:MAG: hypothetical protein JWL84_1666 [Rhodospirillales bacterium]|nr:hypothetical protein [Rhodospirillales bacterium]